MDRVSLRLDLKAKVTPTMQQDEGNLYQDFDTNRKLQDSPLYDPISDNIKEVSKHSNKIHAEEVIADHLDISQQIQDRSCAKPKYVGLDEYTKLAIKTKKLPIKLTWKDVSFSVVQKHKQSFCKQQTKSELHILKSVSGYAMPGTTTFIMGASGSGKTSLLNLISDRVRNSADRTIKGEIKFNDKVDVN